jgi:hypothetical protein
MVEQGAVSIDGAVASDSRTALAARTEPYLVKVGKRRFARIRIVER